MKHSGAAISKPPSFREQHMPSASNTASSARILYLLAVGLYAVVFTFWRFEPIPVYVHLIAILVAATCFIPMAVWYSMGSQGLPMFELICLAYAAQFSLT